jgi:Condensation domain
VPSGHTRAVSTSRSLEIGFSSGSSGTAQATWGQHAIWDVVRTLGADAARYNVSVCAPVVPGLPEALVVDSVRQLFDLHDSLRTRLLPTDANRLDQVLDSSGSVSVVVLECAADEVAREADALLAQLSGRPFDCAREWPLRVGLVETTGLVRYIVLSLSHTAVDARGLRRMGMNLTAIAQGEAVATIRQRVPALQPLDEAAFQASDRGQRQDATSRRYWAKKLTQGPRHLFRGGGPVGDNKVPAGRSADVATRDDPARQRGDSAAQRGDPGGGSAGDGAGPGERGGGAAAMFPNAVLDSPALAMAVEHVAAKRRVSSSSVLLAAASAMVSRLSGSPEALLQIVVNNRFLPGLANSVSTVAQEGLFHLTDADRDFPDLVRRANMVSLATYRGSYYDKRRLDEDIARLVDENGAVCDTSCFFNDARNVVPLQADGGAARVPLARALARTTLSWPVEFEPRRNVTFAMDALDAPGSIALSMTADGSVIPRTDMARFLHGIEDLVVGEAVALGLA